MLICFRLQHIRDLPHQRDHFPHTAGMFYSLNMQSLPSPEHVADTRAVHSQGAEVEIPIGFAVALSTVMSSRLCLNVRGHIRENSSTTCHSTLPGPTSPSALHSPRTTRNAHVSFADGGEHVYEYESGSGSGYVVEQDDAYLYVEAEGEGKGLVRSESNRSAKIVQEGAPLGVVEMRELRVMRAESPGPLRMKFSMGKKEEILHIR